MFNTFPDSVENYLMGNLFFIYLFFLMGNLNYTFEKELTCSVIPTGMLLRCPAIFNR